MPSDPPRPSTTDRDEATTQLTRWSGGDGSARDRLFAMVQVELRAMASGLLRGERAGHTLQPTALVNEAWLRMIHAEDVGTDGKGRFLSLAARAMRQILVEHARSRGREKRGGGWRRVELDDDGAATSPPEEIDLVALDRALERLKERSEHLARLVELRFFAGLSHEEVALALGVSSATVGRDWRAARALLTSYLLQE